VGGETVQDPQLALVHLPAAVAVRPREARSLAVFGIAGLFAIGVFLAGLPLVSMGVIAAIAGSGLVLGSRAVRSRGAANEPLRPETIVSIDIRETYRAILIAFGDLERTIAEAPRLRSPMRPVLERCAAAVRLCGEMARSSNPLQRYLDAHDPAIIGAELDRLRTRAEAATDERAVTSLGHAAAARARQLATRDEIAVARDRIHARLELVGAALESFAAMVVKLEVVDDDQFACAGETVADHLDGAGEDLEVVESALGEIAA
jgi:DNA-directed RNA polymerase subunit K/omega